jgi:glycosyltransferase involved in cell wall biosynthesis
MAIDVYVVDDGSKDATAAIAKAEGAEVLIHEANKGKGASLIDGFKFILGKNYDACLVMDGDGQHRVDDVQNFLKRMDETNADMIIGNRMREASSMPFVRRHTNLFMSRLISRIARQEIPDTQCGFRLIKRSVLEKIKLESANFEIDSEIIIRAAKAHFRIESAPVKTIYLDEKSRINPIIDTVRFIMLLLKLK